MSGQAVAVKRIPDPKVIPPYYVRRTLSQLFSPVMLQILPQLLPRIPPWIKAVLVSLVLINIKSFPLLWHIRVLGAAVISRNRARPSVHALLPWIRSNKYPTTSPGITPRLRLDQVPLGRDIFTDRFRMVLRATPDDCDWNGHMSNSSYPRSLDHPRIAFFSSRFLRVHFDGGHWALGGSNFIFHREIPFMAKYEVECSIGGWDEKWFYIIARFMSPSKPTPTKSSITRSKSAQNLKKLLGEVTKPHHEAEKLERKHKTTQITPSQAETQKQVKDEWVHAKDQNDKRTLYCTSVSRYCTKAGRKTIPPWFVVATSGYGTYASTHSNWSKAENLRRETLAKAKADHEAKTGKPMPKDSFVMGSGYRKGGILYAYDPARKPNDTSDERGLGSFQDPQSWHLAEWEERRVRGLELVKTLGGLAQPDLISASHSVAFLE